MTPERWRSVSGILAEVLQTDILERPNALRRLCAGDQELRVEVESLLSADKQAGSLFLEIPAAATHPSAPADSLIDRRIGVYRILNEIGSGGMGTVYRAIRDDSEYQQLVAIKIVRAGLDTALIGDQLRIERQILAGLDHPHIARLLDGGSTDTGAPYLVMELIDGVPINRFCDDNKLDLDSRLNLFLLVCSAVQHAHGHMVIHRDLKPSNVLVTFHGAPKLLDFGIAKILDPEKKADPADKTRSAYSMLTPLYASPEQLKGEAITAASDVFSLGVIFYELLAGRHPFSDLNLDPHEMLNTVNKTEPIRPSLIAARRKPATPDHPLTSTKAHRHLRGDLDNIALMALRRDAERRYKSVEQFAEDIRRHLRHLPVLARKDTLRYRTSTFVARNRVGVAAAILLAIALIGGIIATTLQARRAELALARARDEARISSQVTEYLESLFDAAGPDRTGGKPIDPRRLIDQGQSTIDEHLRNQPLLRARMLSVLGSLYCKVGQSEQCRKDLELALLIQRQSPATDIQTSAEMQYKLASAYTAAGRASDALALLELAIPVLEKRGFGGHQEQAAAWLEKGKAYRLQLKPRDEIAALEYARMLLRDPDGNDTVESVVVLGALAIAYAEATRWSEATDLAARRVAIVRQSFGAEGVQYFDALNDEAEVDDGAGRFEQAEMKWQKAVEGYVRLMGRGSDKTIDAELSLADAMYSRNDLRNAIYWFQRSADDYRLRGAFDSAQYQGALGGLSQVMWEHGDYVSAEVYAQEAYFMAKRNRNDDPTNAALKWGHRLAFIGRAGKALELLSTEIRGDANVLGVQQWRGRQLLWTGDAYRQQRAYSKAVGYYDRAIELYRSMHMNSSVALSMAYEGKGIVLKELHQCAQAAAFFEQAISGFTASHFPPDGPAIAAVKIELADCLAATHQLKRAHALIETAGPIAERELATTHPARIILKRLQDRT